MSDNHWKPITEEFPPVDTRVQIVYERTYNGKTHQIPTYAVYEDGNVLSSESNWIGDGDDWLSDVDAKFNEEYGEYYIPAGWYEVLTGTASEYVCSLCSNEIVTHWMPSPELP